MENRDQSAVLQGASSAGQMIQINGQNVQFVTMNMNQVLGQQQPAVLQADVTEDESLSRGRNAEVSGNVSNAGTVFQLVQGQGGSLQLQPASDSGQIVLQAQRQVESNQTQPTASQLLMQSSNYSGTSTQGSQVRATNVIKIMYVFSSEGEEKDYGGISLLQKGNTITTEEMMKKFFRPK